MKKATLAAFIFSSFAAFAQQKEVVIEKQRSDAPQKKEQQEVIIRSNGDKEISLKVEINGDTITINGKPLAEFKEDNVTIDKRKIIIRKGGDDRMTFNFDNPDGMAEMMELDHLKSMNGAGMSKRPLLGVTTEKATGGAKIVEIADGSAAAKAGLLKGDIITKVDAQTVTDAESLANIISTKKPKEAVTVYYLRQNKKKEVKATLGEKSEERVMTYSFKQPNAMGRPYGSPRTRITPMPDGNMMYDNFSGDNFAFNDMEGFGASFPRQKRLGLKIQDTEEGGNVKVIEVADSSAAQKAGLKKDDIITEINGQKIDNTDDAREQLQEAGVKSSYIIKAKRNGIDMSFDVKIPKKLKTANL